MRLKTYNGLTKRDLLFIYTNYFNRREDMANTFTKNTMNLLLKHDDVFVNRLMNVVENNPILRDYIENMAVTAHQPKGDVKPPRPTYPSPSLDAPRPMKPKKA